jgi:hypothetical protein
MAGRTRNILAKYRGLEVDRPINHTPSGAVRIGMNVSRTDTVWSGRRGFDEWDITFAAANPYPLLQIMPFAPSTGDWFLGVKVGSIPSGERFTGGLAVTPVYSVTAAAPTALSWHALTLAPAGSIALSPTDAGSWFVWRDRLYVFDTTGGQKWGYTTTLKPNNNLYDCWIPGMNGHVGPILAAAAPGAKSGWYFVGATMYNSATKEWSNIQDLQGTALYTAFNDADSPTGGISVTNWLTATTGIYHESTNSNYEWDKLGLACTMGTTDVKGGAASPSLNFHIEQEYARSEATAHPTHNPALELADEALSIRPRHDNGWGPPPLARHACCNGDTAVYGGTTDDPGMVALSRTGFPCSIPGDNDYTIGGLNVTWKAEPFDGFRSHAVEGMITGIGWTGSKFIVATTAKIYWLMRRGGDFTLVADASGGTCISHTGCVSTQTGVYMVGPGELNRASRKGVENLAFERFATMLDQIPSAAVLRASIGNPQAQTVVAAFTQEQEVWIATAWTAIGGCTEAVREDYAGGGSVFKTLDVAYSGTTHAYQFFPDAPATNDAVYFKVAASGTSAAAIALWLAIGRSAAYASTAVIGWEYYNGSAWAALTVKDSTNPDDTTGGRPFLDDGLIVATAPADMAEVTINGVAGMWIRARVLTGKASSMTRVPMLQPEGPRRIFVYDTLRDEMVGYMDPKNLRGASITSMQELALPSGSPRMLIGLEDGRILSFPSENYYDTESGAYHLGYSTEWLAYIGQEQRADGHKLGTLWAHTGTLGGTIGLTVALVQTGTDEPDPPVRLVTASNSIVDTGVDADTAGGLHGKFFRVGISTTISQSPQWELIDLIVESKDE